MNDGSERVAQPVPRNSQAQRLTSGAQAHQFRRLYLRRAGELQRLAEHPVARLKFVFLQVHRRAEDQESQ